MNYSFTTKNFDADDTIKSFTVEKIDRHLEKFLPPDTNISVLFIEVGFKKKIEVTIHLNKRIIRAEMVNTENMRAAVDEVVDILKKQVRRYKNRLDAISKKNVNFQEEFNFLPQNNEMREEISSEKIERIKSFAIKPMDPEEAAMEIELLGHSFYVFLNSDTEEVNVIYKRKNGSYGLIEPKY